MKEENEDIELARSQSLDAEDECLLESDDQIQRRQQHSIVRPILARLATASFVLTACLIVAFAYYLGYSHGRGIYPRLPTHAITKDAARLHLQLLDDEFEVRKPENRIYKGEPRPELNNAWSDLLRGLNFRVPQQVATEVGFDSLELGDGSGDRWATMAVKHNLHCLKRIRESLWPEQYPESWELARPIDGKINPHMDHCIDNLRQALMCNADMTLYRYHWQNDTLKPKPTVMSPHICLDWKRLQDWLDVHEFDIYGRNMLVHPTLGQAHPSL